MMKGTLVICGGQFSNGDVFYCPECHPQDKKALSNKEAYEQALKDVLRLIDEFMPNVTNAGQKLLSDVKARIKG